MDPPAKIGGFSYCARSRVVSSDPDLRGELPASGAASIRYEKMDGLAPAIVQEGSTGEVLMVGFMNAESYQHTVETGYVTFYSRTRKKLWMKGETSGNRLRVISALTDCDRDTVLFRVHVEGDGLVCHTGTKSCFTEPIAIKTVEAPR